MMKKFDAKNDCVMTVQGCREFDGWAINVAGVPGAVLMENAGRSCAEIIIERLKQTGGRKVCVFCGTGNNGGDGFVIARHLHNAGLLPSVFLCGEAAKIKGDAEVNYKIVLKMNIAVGQISPVAENVEEQVNDAAGDCDLIVDAIFGTGFSGALAGGFEKIVRKINSLGKIVAAVDCPSGLDCDTGLPNGIAIKADITVTFAAAKCGFKNPQSKKYTGEVYVASIGIEKTVDS
jgi:NAD(P)H-hydrate epimerase